MVITYAHGYNGDVCLWLRLIFQQQLWLYEQGTSS